MKRKVALATLLLTTSTGVVMASNTACRVVVFQEVHVAEASVHRRVHHSQATLARWKIGAAAWSKSHHGRIYAGQPARPRIEWKPMGFTCAEVELAGSPSDDRLLATDPLPIFDAYASSSSPTPSQTLANAAASVLSASAHTGMWESSNAGGFGYGAAGGGGTGAAGTGTGVGAGGGVPTSGGGLFGGKPIPPLQPMPDPASQTIPMPTPEPPGLVLLVTGIVALGAGKARQWLGR